MPRLLVDGMRLEVPIAVPGLAAAPAGATDWRLAIERRPGGDGLERVTWTGDVRDGSRDGSREQAEPWARFGRRGGERVVWLEGTASLSATSVDRRGVIRHDGPATDDVSVLRHLAPYLASLSGLLTLHAAAVVLPAGAVLLCGGTGEGKSTLALAFDALGVPVLADDHVVVDAPPAGRAVARSSFPFVDVDGASRAAIRPDASAGGEGKSSVALRTAPRPAAAPIAAVAFLSRGERVAHEAMRPADAVARLLREAVFVADPADEVQQAARLDACLRLLAAAPPVRLVVPAGLDLLAAAMPSIAAPWGGLPT